MEVGISVQLNCQIYGAIADPSMLSSAAAALNSLPA